jgi:hypothetical protein
MKSTILALALALTAGSALATETPQPQPTEAKPSPRLHPSKTNAGDVVPSLLVMGAKGYTTPTSRPSRKRAP